MARFSLVSLALLLVAQTSWSQAPINPTPSKNSICKVYALGDWTDDAGLCEWISKTIPQVVEAETKCFLSYYAPSKLMVVYHTPSGHAEVEAFLQNIKRSLILSNKTAAQKIDPSVLPAQFTQPSVFKMDPSQAIPPQTTPSQAMPYAVPAPVKQPKHLFHFIIRYEGAGIVDSNVVDLVKNMNGPGGVPSCPATVSSPYSSNPILPGATLPAANTMPGTVMPAAGLSDPTAPAALPGAMPATLPMPPAQYYIPGQYMPPAAMPAVAPGPHSVGGSLASSSLAAPVAPMPLPQ